MTQFLLQPYGMRIEYRASDATRVDGTMSGSRVEIERHGGDMTTQGLLVQGHNGEDYLLTTEPSEGMKAHRLVVLQKINGEWKHLKDTHAPSCRESLIGAFIDFFVGICRVLNSPSQDQASVAVSTPGRSRTAPAYNGKTRRAK